MQDSGIQNIKKALWCRASQIDNPGARNCKGCPYTGEDEYSPCADLHLMSDALDAINYLEMYRNTFHDALDKGYTIKFCAKEE